MTLERIKTPCIGICKMDVGQGICVGCGRTGSEISCWMGYSDQERDIIMEKSLLRIMDLFDKGDEK